MLNKQLLNQQLKDENELALEQDIRELRSYISINPDDAEAHNDLAWIYYQKGQLELAIAEFEEVLKIKPDNLDARYAIGWFLDELGMLDEAIAKCKEVIEINPKEPRVHFRLASAFKKQNKPQEAIAEYEIGISVNPDYAPGYLWLGQLLLEQGQVDKGILNLKKAKELFHNQGDDSFVETVDIIVDSLNAVKL